MVSAPLILNDTSLNSLLAGTLAPLGISPISAVLLSPAYVPDPVNHSSFAEIAAFELVSAETKRVQLTGVSITGAAFRSDDLIFGDPVTIGPARYLAFVMGAPKSLTPGSILLGVADLAPSGGALEAQRGRFSVKAPASGWFALNRA